MFNWMSVQFAVKLGITWDLTCDAKDSDLLFGAEERSMMSCWVLIAVETFANDRPQREPNSSWDQERHTHLYLVCRRRFRTLADFRSAATST